MTNGKNIFGAFMVAIALFFFWPAVLGSWQEVRALKSGLNEREQLDAKRTEIFSRVAEEYTAYTAAIGGAAGRSFAEVVPIKKDSAELVSAIQDMATSSGITLGELRMNEAKGKDSDQYKTLTLVMSMSGSYRAFRIFVGNLEQYVRVLNINSIDVSSDAGQPGVLKFSINADTYFIR